MNCVQCGTKNQDHAIHCVGCGILMGPPGTTLNPGLNLPGVPAGMVQAPMGKVPNYLVQSILLTLFCCMPLGIVCSFKAVQINKLLAANDYAGALRASKTSRTLLWVGLAVGAVLNFVIAIVTAIGTIKGS